MAASAGNRTEDVQSPAYSDISDDSTPVTDATDLPMGAGGEFGAVFRALSSQRPFKRSTIAIVLETFAVQVLPKRVTFLL